jgi:small GTP-binding protein
MCQFKAVFVGDTNVGKTCLFHRLQHKSFQMATSSTLGGAYARIDLDSAPGCSVSLWDTAGAERFRSLVPVYFRGASVVLIVFDVTSPSSFAGVDIWLGTAKESCTSTVALVLIGNKADLEGAREIHLDVGQTKAQEMGARAYIETSALTGDGCDLLLAELGKCATSPAPLEERQEYVAVLQHEERGGKLPGCC